MHTPKAMEVQRNVVVRTKSGSFTKNKSGAANVVNHLRLTWSIHLVSQPAHMNIDQVRCRNEFVIPDFLQQHCPRQQLVAPLHHVFEQTELARQQVYRPLAARRGAFDEIEFELTNAQDGFAGLGRPPQQAFYARHEFDDCERFREVVVTPHPQSAYTIIDPAERAQYKNGRTNLLPPQPSDDGGAI